MYEITVKDIEAIQDIEKTSKTQYEAFVAILEYGVQLGEQEVLAAAPPPEPSLRPQGRCGLKLAGAEAVEVA